MFYGAALPLLLQEAFANKQPNQSFWYCVIASTWTSFLDSVFLAGWSADESPVLIH
jgi:hypothetical protein